MTREGYTFANSLYPTTRFSRYSMGTGNGAIENSIYTKSRKSFERFIEALHDKRKWYICQWYLITKTRASFERFIVV